MYYAFILLQLLHLTLLLVNKNWKKKMMEKLGQKIPLHWLKCNIILSYSKKIAYPKLTYWDNTYFYIWFCIITLYITLYLTLYWKYISLHDDFLFSNNHICNRKKFIPSHYFLQLLLPKKFAMHLKPVHNIRYKIDLSIFYATNESCNLPTIVYSMAIVVGHYNILYEYKAFLKKQLHVFCKPLRRHLLHSKLVQWFNT